MNRIYTHAIAVVIGGLAVAVGCAYMKFKPSLPSVLAPPAKELAKEETQRLECKPVIVYRDKVKKKLGLPEEIKKDQTKHVVAATTLKSDDHPRTVTAIYSEDGKVTQYVRRDPLPFIDTTTRYSLGFAYGLNDSEIVAKAYGRAELIQIKFLRLGFTGDVESGGRKFIGIGGEVRF